MARMQAGNQVPVQSAYRRGERVNSAQNTHVRGFMRATVAAMNSLCTTDVATLRPHAMHVAITIVGCNSHGLRARLPSSHSRPQTADRRSSHAMMLVAIQLVTTGASGREESMLAIIKVLQAAAARRQAHRRCRHCQCGGRYAFVGVSCLGKIIFHQSYGYDRGFGESTRSAIAGLIIGAVLGAIAASLLSRSRRHRS